MNSVVIIGNLTKDVSISYSTGQKQTAVARMTVAVDSGFGDSKKTSYIPVVVFGKQAENCERYLFKGSKVAVRGRIQTGNYEKEGRKVYTTDVIAEQVEFLRTEQVTQPVQQNELPPQTPEGFSSLTNDDMPF